MITVAIISQTLRADYCHAYLEALGHPAFILTADPSSFDGMDFTNEPQVIRVSPPPELLPSARLLGGRLFRSAIEKARRGSRFGRWAERAAKRLVWRLRYLDRATRLSGSKTKMPTDEASIRASSMYVELVALSTRARIGQIVVFDVFDLPVALLYAEDHEIEILVR